MKRETASERYLRQATRGLWGRKRLEVREELSAHLCERIKAHLLAGFGEADAMEKALAELGAPKHVSVGMAHLYTLPAVMGSSLALLALCLVVVVLWPKGFAQQAVEGSFYFPTEACSEALRTDAFLGVCEQDTSLWLEPDSLKNELRRQGVKVDDEKTLNLTFPNGAHVSLTKEPYSYFNGVTERETFTRAGVIQFTHLYAALLGQPGLLRLEGWSNPTLYIGQVELQIGTEKRPVWGSDFYPNVLMGFFLSKNLYASAIPKGMTYILDVGDVYGSVLATEIELTQPGVYGVITLLPRDIPRPYWMDAPEPSDILMTSEVFEVQMAGSFTVSLPEDVRFVTSFGKDRDENVAVLVRLSGQGITAGYDIVSPEKITLEPSP